MKVVLATALALWASAAASASVITLPLQSQKQPHNLNAATLTKRYLQRRASPGFTKAPLSSIYGDIVYTVPLTLGTPPQPFNVLIDTGSPDTWVSSSTCQTASCVESMRFDCSRSSTCSPSSATFNTSYVDGDSVAGTYIVETFGIGDLKFTAVAAIVTKNNARMVPSVDGIMGLWYYGPGSQIPILNVLKNSTSLTQNVIGIYLQNSSPNLPKAPGGEITFGGLNPARYIEPITYVNCDKARPWTIALGGLTVNGVKIPTSGAMAAIDTGSTAMLIPKGAADLIHGHIPGAATVENEGNLWVIPCTGNTTVSLTFGNFTAAIPYSKLALQSTKQKTSLGYYCLSAAMFPTGDTAMIDEWIIGDVFISQVYSVYDFDTNAASGGRIGFAKLAEPSNPGTGTDGSGTGGDNDTNGGKGADSNNNGAGTKSAATRGRYHYDATMFALLSATMILSMASMIV